MRIDANVFFFLFTGNTFLTTLGNVIHIVLICRNNYFKIAQLFLIMFEVGVQLLLGLAGYISETLWMGE